MNAVIPVKMQSGCISESALRMIPTQTLPRAQTLPRGQTLPRAQTVPPTEKQPARRSWLLQGIGSKGSDQIPHSHALRLVTAQAQAAKEQATGETGAQPGDSQGVGRVAAVAAAGIQRPPGAVEPGVVARVLGGGAGGARCPPSRGA